VDNKPIQPWQGPKKEKESKINGLGSNFNNLRSEKSFLGACYVSG
jgi:hypothetical protein